MMFSRHVVDLNVVIDVILNDQKYQCEISLFLRKRSRKIFCNNKIRYNKKY